MTNGQNVHVISLAPFHPLSICARILQKRNENFPIALPFLEFWVQSSIQLSEWSQDVKWSLRVYEAKHKVKDQLEVAVNEWYVQIRNT